MESEGQRQKREGINTAVVNANTKYRIRFNNRLAELVEAGGSFTSEDVTSVVGIPNDKIVGALMNAAATGGYIRRVEYVPAGRTNQHAAMISRWTGGTRQIERILLAEDLPDMPTKAVQWVCVVCGQPASVQPMPSLDQRYGTGKCLVCQKPSTFQRS
jgi:hypothetical protein